MEDSTKHTGDSIISALRKATTEFEDLQVQLALGKAEATDKYDQFKKSLQHTIAAAKAKLHTVKDKADEVNSKIQMLEHQFALSKNDTKDVLKKQKEKIIVLINEIEDSFKKSPTH